MPPVEPVTSAVFPARPRSMGAPPRNTVVVGGGLSKGGGRCIGPPRAHQAGTAHASTACGVPPDRRSS
jgi:hypothetical protein